MLRRLAKSEALTKSEFSQPESDLLVEEYKSCRELIKKNIEIIESNEIYIVGASGASAIFYLTSSADTAAYVAAWLPLVLSLVGFLRYTGLDQTIHTIDDYLVSLETKFPALGYTSYYRQHPHGTSLRWSRRAVWIILIIFSTAFGTYIAAHGPVRMKETKSVETNH